MSLPTILVATPDEERCAQRYFPEFPTFVMGIGAGNVIASLATMPHDTPVINIGYAGSTDLPIGTVSLVSTTWRLKDETFVFPDPVHGKVLSAEGLPCYTSNSFVTATDITGSALFDMELNYIAAFPLRLVGSIKIVSDNLCLDAYKHTASRDEETMWNDVRRLLLQLTA